MSPFISDLRKVPVLRLLIPYLSGIIYGVLSGEGKLAAYTGDMNRLWIVILLAGMLAGVILFKVHKQLTTYLIGLLFAISGFVNLRLAANHNTVGSLDQEVVLSGEITSFPEEKTSSYVCRLACIYIFMEDSVMPVSQDILLYIQKDSLVPSLVPGDRILVSGALQDIRNNGNPGEFDYRTYMARQNCFHSMYIRDSLNFRVISSSSRNLKYMPLFVRKSIIDKWGWEGKDAAVLTALTLGDKHLLDHETRESFSTAGAMHLLAVSGLHVGMIWLVLDFLLRFPGHRLLFRLLKSILILIILWIYASVTGFSESVTRSVTMFSVLTLSRIIHRESNIYNTLLLSAFIMLLLHPLRISDAGFQLSFLAVLGIVSIQPVWEAFAQARSRILRYLRGLLTVSISAQVATLPLSLHLFHRFPLWFLLTNLAAIPLVSIILCFFVVSLPWIMISPDPEIPVRILLFLVHILNEAIELISGLPHAVIENITVSPLLAFMFYLCIFFFVLFMRYRRFWPLVMTLSVILLTTFLSALEEYNLKQKNLLDIYNIKGQSVISFMRYPNRITYRYNPGKDTVAFTENYINSLSAYPAHIKYHDCVYVDQDSMNLRSDFCELTDGVYSIFIDSLKMLVAGACTDYEMEFIIERQEFDLVLLTHGFPRTDSIRKFTDTGLLIGDGSLSFWEIEWLEEHAPNVFLTRNNGAFSMEFYTGLSFWQ